MNTLSDYFISRDLLAHLHTFIDHKQLQLPNYENKLKLLSNKQHMSYAQWWRLLAELDAETDFPALGVEIGKLVKVEHVGVLGYLFRTSRNVGEALNCFKRFQGLIYAGSQAHTENNSDGTFSLVWNPDYGYSSQCSDEILLSGIVAILNEIAHPQSLSLSSVRFIEPMSAERIQACEHYFQCPVLAEQDRLEIVFAIDDLTIPLPYCDTTLHEILGKQAQDLLVNLPDSDTFISETTDTIIRCLHEGQCDAITVASRLNISERTFHRRLKSKEKVFRDVLQNIRKSMALNYLQDNKLTLSEIALLLGYSEQSSFTRAFTKWFDCSPLQYQKRENSTK